MLTKIKNAKIDDDGYVVGLTYKGAKAAKAGTYGIYAKYYDQGAGTYLWHGMNTELANKYFGETGFKGYMIGVNYAVAKNIVAAVEYSDFDAKDNYAAGKNPTTLSGLKLSSLSNFSESASSRAILRSPFYMQNQIILLSLLI